VLCRNGVEPVAHMHRLTHNLSLHRNLTIHVRRASSIHAALAPCPLKVLPIHHHIATCTGIELTKVENIIALTVDTSMLDLCSDLVVHDCLLVLAHDVDSKLENVLLSQLSWFGFFVFLAQTHTVDECAVATLDILDEDASLSVGVNFGVLSRKYLGVEITVKGGRDGFLVGLSTNP